MNFIEEGGEKNVELVPIFRSRLDVAGLRIWSHGYIGLHRDHRQYYRRMKTVTANTFDVEELRLLTMSWLLNEVHEW